MVWSGLGWIRSIFRSEPERCQIRCVSIELFKSQMGLLEADNVAELCAALTGLVEPE